MQSHYRICVSRRGRHYFSTDDKITDRREAVDVAFDIECRFPRSQGFEVELTYWSCVGRDVEHVL